MRLRIVPSWLLLATACAASQTPSAEGPPHLALESFTLPNGLKVALHLDRAVPRVTVCVAYHVGSKNEKAGRTGFAHFFEHMMFRGTRHVPNYDVPLQEAGAQSNAFTSEDMTVYFETVPSNFLERAVYLEAERLAFLPEALDQRKFDTEREVVKNERRQTYENRPYGLEEEVLLASVFPKGHPYSWSVIGSMNDLNRATLDDLRQFFAEFYHPANATVCLAGDFEPSEARALVTKYFGGIPAGPVHNPVKLRPAPPRAADVVNYDAVQLPRITWAWPTVGDDHPDAPALDLLARVLAGGQASRLHKALVLERRISKDVSAESDAKESAGLFTLQSTAAEGAGPEKSLREIELVFADAVRDLQTTPPTAEELSRALALFEKSVLASLTPPLGRAITLAVGYAQKDDPAYYRKDIARYFLVAPADLKRVAAAYLTPEKVALRTVPLAAGRAKSEAVRTGPSPSAEPERVQVSRTPDVGGPDWAQIPGPSRPKTFQPPSFVRKTLSNGLDVWIAPWKTLPLVSIRLMIPAGTADDPSGKSGLATLTSTLLDKGTRRKTATEFAVSLEALGVTLAAGASSDETAVGFSTVSRNLTPALKALGEVLAEPRFDAKDFDRERGLQLAELSQGPDSVTWIARRALPALLFGAGHPYGNPADGYTETVRSLTLDDVRAFHAARLGPKGATLVVVGDVDPRTLVPALEVSLGGWKPQPEGHAIRPASKVVAEPGVVYLVDKPGAVQSVLEIGRRWVDRSDPRYFATLLGNRILGGDFLSRLNQNLREKNGFTYGASSLFRFRRGGSVWMVSTEVRTDATAAALKEAIGELDALAAGKPFTAEEFATALGAEAKSFPESFEDPASIAGILGEMARFRLPPDYLETFLERLQATGPGSVVKAMAEVVVPKERVVLVVGDRKSIEPKLKELGFTTIRLVTTDGIRIE